MLFIVYKSKEISSYFFHYVLRFPPVSMHRLPERQVIEKEQSNFEMELIPSTNRHCPPPAICSNSKWCNLLSLLFAVRPRFCVATAFFQSTFNHIELQLFYSIWSRRFCSRTTMTTTTTDRFSNLVIVYFLRIWWFCSSFNPKQIENKL